MSRAWRWVIPCYLFLLPMSMVGWVLATWIYKASGWTWRDGVLTCVAGTAQDGSTRIWGKPNAQTLGWVEIFDTEASRQEANLRVHETVHVVQAFAGALLGVVLVPLLFVAAGWSPLLGLVLGGFVGGLGFSLLYGILFLYLLARMRTHWYYAYRANPFEVQAYNLQDKYLADVAAGKDPKPWGV